MTTTKLEANRGGWRVAVTCQGTIRETRAAAMSLAARLELASDGHDWLVHVEPGVMAAGSRGLCSNVTVELATGSEAERGASRSIVLDTLVAFGAR